MCCARPQFRRERILSVVFEAFIKALGREIRFRIRNAGGLGEHPTLERAYKRFNNAQIKKRW